MIEQFVLEVVSGGVGGGVRRDGGHSWNFLHSSVLVEPLPLALTHARCLSCPAGG